MLLDIKGQELLVSKEPFCSGRMHECFEILKRRFQLFKPEAKKALRTLLQIHSLEHKSIILGFGNPSLSDEYALKLPGGLERLHRHFTKLSGLFSPATKKTRQMGYFMDYGSIEQKEGSCKWHSI